MSSSSNKKEDPSSANAGSIDLEEGSTRELDAASPEPAAAVPAVLPNTAAPVSSSQSPASNRPTTTNIDRLPDFKDQVHTVQPSASRGTAKQLKQDPAGAAEVVGDSRRPPPAPMDGGPSFKDQVRQQPQPHSVDPLQQEGEGIRYGPRFKDQCANAQNVPTDRQSSPDQDPAEAGPEEEAGQEAQTGQPLPLTAQVVDDHELEEQMRRRFLGEAVAAQVVTPSQLQPMLRDNALTCKRGLLYVVAGLVLVGIVLGVALPLMLGEGEGPTPLTGGVNEPSVVTNSPTNSPSTEAPTDIKFLSENSKLTASDGLWGDNFGNSVATNGDTMVVGAYWDDFNSTTTNSGSSYVFTRRTGTAWMEQAKLIGP